MTDMQSKMKAEDLEYVTSASQARLLFAPKGASLLIQTVTVLLLGLLVWASFSPIDEVVKAQGKVIPSSHTQVIQSLDGGILKSLDVVEGQVVHKGDQLLEIDNTSAMSLLGEQNANRFALQAAYDRLDALSKKQSFIKFSPDLAHFPELKSHELQVFTTFKESLEDKFKKLEFDIATARSELADAKASYNSTRSNTAIVKKQYQMNQQAKADGVISESDLLNTEANLNDAIKKENTAKQAIESALAKVHSLEQQLESVADEEQNKILKERADVERQLRALEAKVVSAQDKFDRTVITSPINGVIKKIEVTTLGGVIKSGMTILEVVPTDEDLQVEVKVQPKDIGFIRNGLDAMVKISAYDFSKFGGLHGKVEYVSADSTIDQKERSFYTVRIKTDGNKLTDKSGKSYSIIPGMQSEVNIVVGQKSVLSYVFSPLLK